MTAPLATLVDRPLPRFADPLSHRLGALQFERREWQRRQRHHQFKYREASIEVAKREAEIEELMAAREAVQR